jgi:hypothetical protein
MANMKNKDNIEQIIWPPTSGPEAALKLFIRKCQIITNTQTPDNRREAAIKAFNEANSKPADPKD